MEEREWLEEAREIAREYAAYVGVSLMVFLPESQTGEPLKSENKLILIDPAGNVACDFLKRTRVPGSSHEVGEGDLPLISTPYGTWSSAICFDMDFPQVIRPSARQCDLLLAPSNDWPEAAATHSRMAQMRAIENGCCLIRPTKEGYSTVTDACGRIRALAQTYQAPTSVLRSSLTPARKSTIYARIGDLLAWACIALCGVSFVSVVRR